MKFLVYANKINNKYFNDLFKKLWRRPIDLTDNPQIKELFPS